MTGKEKWTPENIIRLRTALKLNKYRFGREVGVSENCVYSWEKGKTKPRDRAIQAFEKLEKRIDGFAQKQIEGPPKLRVERVNPGRRPYIKKVREPAKKKGEIEKEMLYHGRIVVDQETMSIVRLIEQAHGSLKIGWSIAGDDFEEILAPIEILDNLVRLIADYHSTKEGADDNRNNPDV